MSSAISAINDEEVLGLFKKLNILINSGVSKVNVASDEGSVIHKLAQITISGNNTMVSIITGERFKQEVFDDIGFEIRLGKDDGDRTYWAIFNILRTVTIKLFPNTDVNVLDYDIEMERTYGELSTYNKLMTTSMPDDSISILE